MGFGRSRNAVSIAFEGTDNVSPVVRGIKNSMASFKQDAKQGFGLAAGFNIASKAMSIAGQAFGAVINFGSEAIETASALNEAQTKVGEVFEQSAEQVLAWGKTTTEAFGISELASVRAAGNIGNLFTAMGIGARKSADMSTALVELASDLASFNDAEISDVLTALQSGLVGEAEPMRKLGVQLSAARVEAVALSEGLAETKATITDEDKVFARYLIIMQDTAKAQGDFGRTSDGLANSTRVLDAEIEDLKSTIGEGLLPAAKFAVQSQRDMLGVFKSIIGVATPVADAYRTMARGIKAVGDATDEALGVDAIRGFGGAEDFASEFSAAINPGVREIEQLFQGSQLIDGIDVGQLFRMTGGGSFFDFRNFVKNVKAEVGFDVGVFGPEMVRFMTESFAERVDETSTRERADFLARIDPAIEDMASGVGRHVVGVFFGTMKSQIVATSTSGGLEGVDTAELFSGIMEGILGSGEDFASGLFGSERIGGRGKGKGKIRKAILAQLRLQRNNVRDLLADPKLLGWIDRQYKKQQRWLLKKAEGAADQNNPLAALFIGGEIKANDVNKDGVAAAAFTAGEVYGVALDAGLLQSVPEYLAKMIKGELLTITADAKVFFEFIGNQRALEFFLDNRLNPGVGLSGPKKPVIDDDAAHGGSPGPGQTFLIGERGPELLTLGNRGGTINPIAAGGGGDIYLDGRLVGKLLDARLGASFSGTRGRY